MAYPYTSKIVRKKYKLLIENVTDLLFNDDDDGTEKMMKHWRWWNIKVAETEKMMKHKRRSCTTCGS